MATPSSSAGPVAVIGAGINGLTLALRLALAGRQVLLIEASAQCGGLGSAFTWQGQAIERFYHCLLPSDSHLLPLLDELGLAGDVYWCDTSFAYLQRGQVYPLNGARELLAFAPLSLVQRLRVGLAGLKARWASGEGLDDLTCEQWLVGLAGQRAYETFFLPMLRAKFGSHHPHVPALWFWSRLNREKGRGPERKGYLPGGYRRIAQTLQAAAQKAGAQVLTQTAVLGLELLTSRHDSGFRSDRDSAATFGPVRLVLQDPKGQTQSLLVEQAVYTAPLPLLPPLLQGHGAAAAVHALGEVADMQGVVNSVWALKRSITPHYWVAAMDGGLPFQGLVQTSNLVRNLGLAGSHLVYLTRYVHRSSPSYAQSDGAVLRADLEALAAQFPQLALKDVRASWVFRSPYVEPLYTLGYANSLPPIELVPERLFLATSSQVYPQVTSWNAGVGLAEQAAKRVLAASVAPGAWPDAPAPAPHGANLQGPGAPPIAGEPRAGGLPPHGGMPAAIAVLP